jgi:hypothetical protein
MRKRRKVSKTLGGRKMVDLGEEGNKLAEEAKKQWFEVWNWDWIKSHWVLVAGFVVFVLLVMLIF